MADTLLDACHWFNGYRGRRLRPALTQQEIDEASHVADRYITVKVAVGSVNADSGCVLTQQIIDESSNVRNGDILVHVYVAADHLGSFSLLVGEINLGHEGNKLSGSFTIVP